MRNRFSSGKAFLAFLVLIQFVCLAAFAAPRRYQDDENANALREMRDGIDSLRHEVDNHETELHMYDERISNQEATISSLRQQLLDANLAHKEMVKGSSSSQDTRISGLEATNKGLAADLQQLKSHANETATALGQYKQRIAELEKLIALQTQNIENLQAALRSLTEALQVKEGTAVTVNSNGDKIYRVKPGDSIEKIARNNNTTIKAIKELNNLSSDKIVVGQSLQLP